MGILHHLKYSTNCRPFQYVQISLRQKWLENLGNRKVTVCRELTKKHETVFATTLQEAVMFYETNEPKGECVLAIEGRSWEELRQEQVSKWEEMDLNEHMDIYLNQGIDKKEAMKLVAKDRRISKRDVYQQLL